MYILQGRFRIRQHYLIYNKAIAEDLISLKILLKLKISIPGNFDLERLTQTKYLMQIRILPLNKITPKRA